MPQCFPSFLASNPLPPKPDTRSLSFFCPAPFPSATARPALPCCCSAPAVGLGCFIGPVVLNCVIPPHTHALRWGVATSYCFFAAGLLVMLLAPTIFVVLLSTIVRSMGEPGRQAGWGGACRKAGRQAGVHPAGRRVGRHAGGRAGGWAGRQALCWQSFRPPHVACIILAITSLPARLQAAHPCGSTQRC